MPICINGVLSNLKYGSSASRNQFRVNIYTVEVSFGQCPFRLATISKGKSNLVVISQHQRPKQNTSYCRWVRISAKKSVTIIETDYKIVNNEIPVLCATVLQRHMLRKIVKSLKGIQIRPPHALCSNLNYTSKSVNKNTSTRCTMKTDDFKIPKSNTNIVFDTFKQFVC